MALSNATYWEVRTTGLDSNGGGFVSGASGTDYSQQDAAQYTFTDLASTNGTTNPSVVTSASHNFVAADVGNIIQITAGTNWTTGFYQIVSVASNAATLDRAVGSAASLSGGTWAEGGALLTIGKAMGAVVARNKVYIKSGTYTITAAISVPSLTNPVDGGQQMLEVRGYGTTRDDGGTRPIITSSTNSITKFAFSGGYGYLFYHLNITDTAATRGDAFGATATAATNDLIVDDCVIDGCLHAVYGDWNVVWTFDPLCIFNTEIKNCTSSEGALNNTGSIFLHFSFIHNQANGSGFYQSSNASRGAFVVCVHTIFYNNASNGFYTQKNQNQEYVFINCAFVSNTSDGLQFNPAANVDPPVLIMSCIFYGNGGYGINSVNTRGFPTKQFNNAFGSNTSGNYHNWPTGSGDIALTATPFNNAGSSDFSLNSTAGGGAVLRSVGFPGTASYGIGYEDVGALRHQDPAGGGGGLLVNPGMTGGVRG